MTYVTADLHGISPARFQKMLAGVGFSEEDMLYILGDVIDRGEYGAELLAWVSQMPNIQLILGNHEAMLLSCDFLFDTVDEERLDALTAEKLELVGAWYANGAGPTVGGFGAMLKKDPELVEGILDYLRESPLYERVQAGGREYLLTHAGLGNFHPDKPLDLYTPEELTMLRPEPEQRYFGPEGPTVVFGHTPAAFYDPGRPSRAYHGPGWICIDTGAAMGACPMMLRLEDGKEFYWKPRKRSDKQ